MEIWVKVSWRSLMNVKIASLHFRLTIKASCPMYLHYFPVDEQSCPLQFGSCEYDSHMDKAVMVMMTMMISPFQMLIPVIRLCMNGKMDATSLLRQPLIWDCLNLTWSILQLRVFLWKTTVVSTLTCLNPSPTPTPAHLEQFPWVTNKWLSSIVQNHSILDWKRGNLCLYQGMPPTESECFPTYFFVILL